LQESSLPDMKPQQSAINAIVLKAWRDPAFAQALKADTTKVLINEGLPLPEGLNVVLIEDTDTTVHLVIPRAPIDLPEDDEELFDFLQQLGATKTNGDCL